MVRGLLVGISLLLLLFDAAIILPDYAVQVSLGNNFALAQSSVYMSVQDAALRAEVSALLESHPRWACSPEKIPLSVRGRLYQAWFEGACLIRVASPAPRT